MAKSLDSFVRWSDCLLAATLAAMGRRLYRSDAQSLVLEIERLSKSALVHCTKMDIDMLGRALVSGEDRRFRSHPGIDTRGLIRALLIRFRGGALQGASTITQQLVRVLTRDYRLSVRRKFREMCLACVIDRAVAKDVQISAYLRVGYFGWRMTGCDQAVKRLRLASPLDAPAAAEVVARLRYPQPRNPTDRQLTRVRQRAAYIVSRFIEPK